MNLEKPSEFQTAKILGRIEAISDYVNSTRYPELEIVLKMLGIKKEESEEKK